MSRKPISLERLYEMAHEEAELSMMCWHASNFPAMKQFILRRDALIDAIFSHPDNPYTLRAIRCEVIPGFTGCEGELKAA